MKISSASKKVLASALSAAMVVAFAPTVALGVTPAEEEAAAIAAGATVKAVVFSDGTFANKYYENLKQAVDSASFTGGTLTLLKDQDLKNTQLVLSSGTTGIAYTIDLNGHNISGTVNDAALVSFAAGDTVTIKGDGEITNDGEDTTAVVGAPTSVAGVDKIEGGTYNKAVSGTIDSIKGGTFAGKVTSSKNAAITIEGGTFNAGFEATDAAGALTLKGGTFKVAGQTDADKYNASDVYAVKAVANIIVTAGATVSAEAETTLKADANATAYSNKGEGNGSTTATTAGQYSEIGTSALAAGASQAEMKAAYDGGTPVAAGAVLSSGKYYIEKGTAATSGDAYAIYTTGDVTLQANGDKGTYATVSATATANGNDNLAEAIHAANVTVSKAKTAAASLTAAAAAKGVSSAANASAGAAAVHATTAVTVDGTADLSASVVDDSSYAYAAKGTGDVSFAAGSYTTDAAEGKGYAIYTNSAGKITVAGGTFVGKLFGSETANSGSPFKGVKGGTFSVNPTAWVADNFKAYDNGKDYVVGVKTATVANSFALAAGSNSDITYDPTATAVAVEAGQAVVDAIIDGTTPAGFAFAEGQDASKLTGAITKGTTIAVQHKVTKINTRTATDAQKAIVAAIDDYAKKNLSVADVYYTVELQLTYTANGKTVVLGTITDLGETRGKANTLQFKITAPAGATTVYSSAQGTNTVVAYDGTAVTQLAYATKDKGQTDVLSGATVALAVLENSDELLKDAVINGEQPAPAPEKATQGIDVSKKSRTVKLAKGKTKTQKALYFKMGASAETTLATAKKSGSSRITVSGDKVTLKKGTKKGTYTAKVSLKAAGSDEYLAAAKTITVKFVVKK